MTDKRKMRRIDTLSRDAFVQGWKQVVGEPPAALLEDRKAMIAMLVESVPVAEARRDGRPPSAGGTGGRR